MFGINKQMFDRHAPKAHGPSRGARGPSVGRVILKLFDRYARRGFPKGRRTCTRGIRVVITGKASLGKQPLANFVW